MSTDLHTCIRCAYKNIFVAMDILCLLLAGRMLRLLFQYWRWKHSFSPEYLLSHLGTQYSSGLQAFSWLPRSLDIPSAIGWNLQQEQSLPAWAQAISQLPFDAAICTRVHFISNLEFKFHIFDTFIFQNQFKFGPNKRVYLSSAKN
jgi:hypothetical protein